MAAFPKTIATIGWGMSSWPLIKSQADNANTKKLEKKRPHWMLKNAACSHFQQIDWHTSLPFMHSINTLSRIAAIPQLRATLWITSSFHHTVCICNTQVMHDTVFTLQYTGHAWHSVHLTTHRSWHNVHLTTQVMTQCSPDKTQVMTQY